MQNLIRIANEIAGKGVGKDGENGEPIGDDIEAINQAQPETEETLQVVENIATQVLERLINLQENISFEMSDKEIDLAIDSIINDLMEQFNTTRRGDLRDYPDTRGTAYRPEPGQSPRNLPIEPQRDAGPGARRDHAEIIGDELWNRDRWQVRRDEVPGINNLERGMHEIGKRKAARERRYEYEDQQEPVSKRQQDAISTALRRNKDLFAGKSPDEVEKMVKGMDIS